MVNTFMTEKTKSESAETILDKITQPISTNVDSPPADERDAKIKALEAELAEAKSAKQEGSKEEVEDKAPTEEKEEKSFSASEVESLVKDLFDKKEKAEKAEAEKAEIEKLRAENALLKERNAAVSLSALGMDPDVVPSDGEVNLDGVDNVFKPGSYDGVTRNTKVSDLAKAYAPALAAFQKAKKEGYRV